MMKKNIQTYFFNKLILTPKTTNIFYEPHHFMEISFKTFLRTLFSRGNFISHPQSILNFQLF